MKVLCFEVEFSPQLNEDDMKEFLLVLLAVSLLSGCNTSKPSDSEQMISAARTQMANMTPIPENDAGTDMDTQCDSENSLKVDYGNFTGVISDMEDEDCYTFDYHLGDMLEVTVSSTSYISFSPSLYFENLYRGDDSVELDKIDRANAALTYSVGQSKPGVESPSIQVKLSLSNLGAGNYNVQLKASPQNDADTGGDLADGMASTEFPAGTYTGFVGFADYCDEYAYPELQEGQTLLVTVQPAKEQDLTLNWWEGGSGLESGLQTDYVMMQHSGMENSQGVGAAESVTFQAGEILRLVSVCTTGEAGEYLLTMSVK